MLFMLFSIHGFFLYEKTNETTASERNSSSMDLSYKHERKNDDIEFENSSSMDFPHTKNKR